MRKKQPKLALLTIGQSPRADLWEDIAPQLKFSAETQFFGLLDDPHTRRTLVTDSPGPDSLVTRLKNGSLVWISSGKAHGALERLIDQVTLNIKPDGIIILCTAIRKLRRHSSIPIFYPCIMIRERIFIKPELPLGVILPKKEQWPHVDHELFDLDVILCEAPPKAGSKPFQKAAESLAEKGARLVVFHCMGYPVSATEPFIPSFENAIIHPRKILAQELNKIFA